MCPNFCIILVYIYDTDGTHVGLKGEGYNGHMTVVLNIYQHPHTYDRYVHDRHRSDHISPVHFAVHFYETTMMQPRTQANDG